MSKEKTKPCTECGSKLFRIRVKNQYTIEIICTKCGHKAEMMEEHTDDLI